MANTKIYRASDPITPRSLVDYERQVLEEPFLDEGGQEEGHEALTREAILAEARLEAAEKVKEAYAEGLRRGLEAAQAQYQEQVAESAAALQVAAGRMAEAREAFLASLEPQVVDLTVSVIRKVFQRELQSDSKIIRTSVRRALEHLVDRETVVVRLNPRDAEGLRSERVMLLEEFEGIRQMTIQTDASIAPGGCIVESALMQVDARLDSQLESILDEILEAAGTQMAPSAPAITPSVSESSEDAFEANPVVEAFESGEPETRAAEDEDAEDGDEVVDEDRG